MSYVSWSVHLAVVKQNASQNAKLILKSEQQIAVKDLLLGKNILAVLPTGYGKSLTFTLFLLAQENITRINTDGDIVYLAMGLTGLQCPGLLAASPVAEIHFFRWGAEPSKFPTKLSNFRQTPPFALEKAVFSPLIGQNFQKFVIFHEGGGGGGGGVAAPWPPKISATALHFLNFLRLSLPRGFVRAQSNIQRLISAKKL
jgi:hypothetical protein